jgi:hypothetical protein
VKFAGQILGPPTKGASLGKMFECIVLELNFGPFLHRYGACQMANYWSFFKYFGQNYLKSNF